MNLKTSCSVGFGGVLGYVGGAGLAREARPAKQPIGTELHMNLETSCSVGFGGVFGYVGGAAHKL